MLLAWRTRIVLFRVFLACMPLLNDIERLRAREENFFPA